MPYLNNQQPTNTTMKNLTTTLIVFLLTATTVFGQFQKNEIDEFTGKVTIVSDNAYIDNDKGHTSAVTFASIDGTYAIMFEVVADSWVHLSDDTAYFLIDGERMEQTKHQADSDVWDGGRTYEKNIFMPSEAQYRAIVNGTDVRFRLGGIVYTIDSEALSYGRAVWDEVN